MSDTDRWVKEIWAGRTKPAFRGLRLQAALAGALIVAGTAEYRLTSLARSIDDLCAAEAKKELASNHRYGCPNYEPLSSQLRHEQSIWLAFTLILSGTSISFSLLVELQSRKGRSRTINCIQKPDLPPP